jgi:hypothetical protein
MLETMDKAIFAAIVAAIVAAVFYWKHSKGDE